MAFQFGESAQDHVFAGDWRESPTGVREGDGTGLQAAAECAGTWGRAAGQVPRLRGAVGTSLERLRPAGGRGPVQEESDMVVSDHGTLVLDHGAFKKGEGRLHAHSARLNWMMRHPGPGRPRAGPRCATTTGAAR